MFVLAACVVAGWYFFFGPSPIEKSGRARQQSAPVVKTAKLEPRDLQRSLDVIGTLQADEEVVITPEISGRVTKLHFEEGERVAAGAPLLELDNTEWQAQLAKEAAEFELARLEEQRAQELLTSRGVAQAAYDTADAKRGVASAEMQLARSRLEKTIINAPFDGSLGVRNVSVGSLLEPGDEVVTLQRLDPVKIEFSVPEEYVALIRTGATVVFSVPGGGRSYEAKVYAIEPRVDPVTRTVLIRAKAGNPNRILLPGGFARVRVPLQTIEDALVIPPLALIPGLSKKSVFRLNQDIIEQVEVETGLRSEEGIEIRKGLSAGDVIVTGGVQQLRSGMRVEPASRQEPPA